MATASISAINNSIGEVNCQLDQLDTYLTKRDHLNSRILLKTVKTKLDSLNYDVIELSNSSKRLGIDNDYTITELKSKLRTMKNLTRKYEARFNSLDAASVKKELLRGDEDVKASSYAIEIKIDTNQSNEEAI